MRFAIATCQELPGADMDEGYLVQALKDRGHEVESVIWTDAAIDYRRYDACVIRSTWDYQQQPEAFLTWAHKVASQTVLLNPLDVVTWNINKTYLKKFEAVGIPIVPTQFIKADDLSELHNNLLWPSAILKPAISAAALNTFQVNTSTTADQFHAIEQTALQTNKLDWLLQPYLGSIETAGEISLMYVNKRFCHAIQKRPSPGDFRVQEHLGGELVEYEPTPQQRELADHVLAQVSEDLVYARVDLMQNENEQWCLSELELTEPSMFFRFHHDTAKEMAEAILVATKAACSPRS